MEVISEKDISAFAPSIKGEVIDAKHASYDTARKIWNSTFDETSHPLLIVRPKVVDDVVSTVKFASAHSEYLAVRGGGHNIAGHGTCSGGILLDLSLMRKVTVNPEARTVVVEGGARLGDIDAATQAHGLVVPLGINSTTGVGGLTLGGGLGWCSRQFGLAIDNLLAVEIVTANGEVINANETDHPDLFWAVRGGGGNFGVVSAFTFRAHPVGPTVQTGIVVHKGDDLLAVMRAYAELQLPESVTCFTVIRLCPPFPFVPAEYHGTPVVLFAYLGIDPKVTTEDLKTLVKPLTSVVEPIANVLHDMEFAKWQQAFDEANKAGARNYWKSLYLNSCDDVASATLLQAVKQFPSPDCEILVGRLGGAVNRVPKDATAYPHRNIDMFWNVHTRWTESSGDTDCKDWARRLYKDMLPHSNGQSYSNFAADAQEGVSITDNVFAHNLPRLQTVKRRYDPKNLFRCNVNIAP